MNALNKSSTNTFSISTKSLDYIIGTFRIPNYDTPGLPLNTRISPTNALEYGAAFATLENQISPGVRRGYNQSRYFAHNRDSISLRRARCETDKSNTGSSYKPCPRQ